jgi:hypothetical protein
LDERERLPAERDLRAQARARAGRALELERSVEGADPVAQTAQPAPVAGPGAAHAVVAHLDRQAAVLGSDPDACRAGLGVLDKTLVRDSETMKNTLASTGSGSRSADDRLELAHVTAGARRDYSLA